MNIDSTIDQHDAAASEARPTRRSGKRLGLAAIAAVAAVSFAVVTPASASVVSSTGASVTMAGSCGNGAVGVSRSNSGFDYVRTIDYVHGSGWGNWSSWGQMSQGIAAGAFSVDHRNAYVAIYVQVADWNGYAWEFGGEWLTFGNSYWCYI